MLYTKEHFRARVNAVAQTSARRGKNEYVTRINESGVLIAKAKRRRFHFPVKGALALILAFFGFKAIMLISSGPDAYAERVAILENGTVIEAMGARVLAVDPITQIIANQAGAILR